MTRAQKDAWNAKYAEFKESEKEKEEQGLQGHVEGVEGLPPKGGTHAEDRGDRRGEER